METIINGAAPETLGTKHKERISSIIGKIDNVGVKFNEENFGSILKQGKSQLNIVDMELDSYISENGFEEIQEHYKDNLFNFLKNTNNSQDETRSYIKSELGLKQSIGGRAEEIKNKITSVGLPFNEDNFKSAISSSNTEQDVELRGLEMPEILDAIEKNKDYCMKEQISLDKHLYNKIK